MAHQRDYDVHVQRSVTILKPPEELYRAWRPLETLMEFMTGARAVEVLDDRRSRWEVEMPALGVESWTSEITEDRENRRISWRTIGSPRFEHEGTVLFLPAPNDLGTEVRLEIWTRVPGGPLAGRAAKVVGRAPEEYVVRTLYNFKQLMETGEVATNEGPTGQRRLTTGLAPKVAALGMGAGVLLTTLYLKGRHARGKSRR